MSFRQQVAAGRWVIGAREDLCFLAKKNSDTGGAIEE